MNFQVQWEEQARDDLGDIWLGADSATRVTMREATHLINEELSRDPYTSGESREDERRVLFAGPLGILFRVDDVDRRVRVVRVWQVRRRKK